MSSLAVKPLAKKITFEKNTFSVHLADGRILIVPLAYFPRLLVASSKERLKYEISGGGTGLHWNSLDEDISVEFLLMGIGDRTRNPSGPKIKKTG
jgi:Protein of unknown function (DUF2442)